VEPPAAVIGALRRVVEENLPHTHGYMPNAGYPEVRAQLARRLAASTGLPFAAEHLIMTSGAAGAINTVLKSILDPGDEVIVLNPCFPEYRFYIENHGGRVVPVETTADFLPDPDRIAAAVTPRTKALILNSPNNPTGRLYPAGVLRELNAIVRDPLLAISDEPVSPDRIRFGDGRRHAGPDRPLRVGLELVESDGDRGRTDRLPGDFAAPPGSRCSRQRLHVRPPHSRLHQRIAIWQRVVAIEPEATVDVSLYQAKRDRLCGALQAMGYDSPRPEGSLSFSPGLRFPTTSLSSALCRKKASSPSLAPASPQRLYAALADDFRARKSSARSPAFERAIRKVRAG